MLFRATPLIMTGLSVAVAFKTGLFNIGAPGQYLMGTLRALLHRAGHPTCSVARLADLDHLPSWAACWPARCGAAIPGLFKAFLNINEVLACIMTNWIGGQPRDVDVRHQQFQEPGGEHQVRLHLQDQPINGVADRQAGAGQAVPRTRRSTPASSWPFCFAIVHVHPHEQDHARLRAEGLRRQPPRGPLRRHHATSATSCCPWPSPARSPARRGALYYLSGNTEFYWCTYQTLPADGLQRHPRGAAGASTIPSRVIFTGIFMSMLNIVGLQLTNLTAYNEYITDVIIAAIVYLSAFSLVIRMLLDGRKKKRVRRRTARRPRARAVARRPGRPDPATRTGRADGAPSRKEASRHDVSDPTDPDLCRAADDRGAGRRVRRAQRHHQPRAGGHHDLRRVHRRAVRAP